ncbi:MAG: hypothetical protein KJ808_07780 [Acidobacteria bacterium]|nr:hypothetical protein [Acidobacteriota bacterium]MBU4306957.1 hypothetical protein [Acidobacteriota bacterium]MBU4405302.1 hypothetical protein [Acidobacteriota bacterium]MCG2812180.1 hypothetical protein [Candidatus Aminicenantes bacterium]
MKRKMAVLLLLVAIPLCGGTYFQFGVESFLGGKYHLFSLAPWGGLRFSLGNTSSLILKFRQQTIAFDSLSEEEIEKRQKSSLSMVTGVYYYQQGKIDAYVALFQMFGSGRYSAIGVDAGLAYKLFRGVAVETGLYLLNEKSTLWYPDEAARRISLFVWHAGMKLALAPKLGFNPQVHFGNNSEAVGTFAYSASLTYSPRDPMYITLTYTRYSENDEYRFSGNYFSGGINFYF